MILYQYTIRTNSRGYTEATESYFDKGKQRIKTEKLPIATVYDNAENNPIIAAGLLRDIAKYAIEQAEIIEELETGKPIPEREIFVNYVAELVNKEVNTK